MDALHEQSHSERMMPKFILAYHGGKQPATPEEGAKDMARFRSWIADLGAAAIEPANPIGKSKTVSADGVTDGGGVNPLMGYTIVEAPSMDAAVEMAKACPFVEMGTLEVGQIMSM